MCTACMCTVHILQQSILAADTYRYVHLLAATIHTDSWQIQVCMCTYCNDPYWQLTNPDMHVHLLQQSKLAADKSRYACEFTATIQTGSWQIKICMCIYCNNPNWQLTNPDMHVHLLQRSKLAADKSRYACAFTATIHTGSWQIQICMCIYCNNPNWQLTNPGMHVHILQRSILAADKSRYACAITATIQTGSWQIQICMCSYWLQRSIISWHSSRM